MDRAGGAIVLGLCLVSAALLHLEITLTKIFSVVLWYHFGFLAIGVALLGFAAAGVYLTYRPKQEGRALRRSLARRALFAAAGIFVGFLLLTHSQFDTFSILRERREALFLVYMLEAALPFFLIGLTIAATLSAFPRQVGALYAANLAGSAIGCLTAVVALNHLTGQQAVFAALALAGAGAALMALPAGVWAVLRNVVVAGVLLFLGLRYTDTLFRLLPIPSKMFATIRPEDVEVSDWSSLAKVDIMAIGDTHQGLWGISDARFRDPWFEKAKKEGFSPYPPRKGILIDEWAITSILDPRGPFSRENRTLTCLEYLPAGAVHRIKHEGSIVCIGAGGGLDVATALYFGQQRVVAVEINHVIVDAMKGTRFAERNYPEFSGNLYLDPRVEAVAAEGRHFLERTPESYDIIQLSGVDTHSATEAGAFSLAENFLYTVEAFQAYYDRLKPGGILTLTRWMLLRENYPTQSLRLFTLACESLRRRGVTDPGRHIYYFRSGIFVVILVSLEPFAPAALEKLDALLEAQLYDPLHRPHRTEPDAIAIRNVGQGTALQIPNMYRRYLEALEAGPRAVETFYADYPFNVTPPTDDRPFFFEDYRFRNLWQQKNLINPLGGLSSHATLALLFLCALVAGYLFLYLPVRRLSTLGLGASERARTAAYFGAIGLAYLLVEIPLSQRFILFLGQPAYALTVILFSLLVFSGLGSWVAGRFGRGLMPAAILAPLAVAIVAGVMVFALPQILGRFLALSLPARVAISVALLAPMGFLMGFPFPMGIRLMEAAGRASAIPWAWAMNGYASVLAAVGAVILGITWGFTTAVLIAAACYVAAAVLAPVLKSGGSAVRVNDDRPGSAEFPSTDALGPGTLASD